MEVEYQTEEKKKDFPKIVLILIIIVIGLGLGYLGFEYIRSTLPKDSIRDPEYVQKDERIENILDEVGNIMILPEDEVPTIVSLIDVDELKKENYEFYKDALKDDILIIYSDKAIIYREDEGRIVNVAPVVLEENNKDSTNILEKE